MSIQQYICSFIVLYKLSIPGYHERGFPYILFIPSLSSWAHKLLKNSNQKLNSYITGSGCTLINLRGISIVVAKNFWIPEPMSASRVDLS